MKTSAKQVIFERVVPQNFKEFSNLMGKLAEYERLAPPDPEATERLRKDCLSKNPRFEAFLVKKSDIAVAYMMYFFTYSSFLALPTLFLEDIFVLEEYRGQGIGRRIFDFCKEIALKKGCGRIELTVLDWNKSAQKFYEENKAQKSNWYFYRVDKNDF